MPQSFALTCHASTPTEAIEAIAVRVQRSPDELVLRFSVDGALQRLRIPAAESPRMALGLWQHTCFEAFIGRAAGAGYHEVNLSPSGAWTVHAFRDYRDGGPLSDESLAPATIVRLTPTHLELEARMRFATFAPEYARVALRVGLAAVMELDDGTLTYWALHHAPGQPDFHHSDAFALRI